jgi:MFS family permease
MNATTSPVSSAIPPGIADASAEARRRLQRRTLRVLMAGQMMGSAGVSVAVTVGGPVVKTLTGADTFAGSASACATFGGALAGLILSARMRRLGRRPGFMLGYTIAFLGGLVVIAALENRSLPFFLIGLVFFGVGQGTNLLTRYAAADLALPEKRSTAISLLLFGSTFGSVTAQILVGWCEKMATKAGLWSYTGPFVFATVLLSFAALNMTLFLRPDPLVVAGGVDPDAPRGMRLPPIGPSLRLIRSIPSAKLALTAMILSQMTMVAIMTMTPIHMKDHGHSGTLAGYVIAMHIVGMYAFAPVVGRAADRYGRIRMVVFGSITLILATIVTALSGPVPGLAFLGLFLLGLGWCGCMVSGSSLLVESIPLDRRLGVQGSADLLMSMCGGLGGFTSGFVKRAFGYHVLSNFGLVAVGFLFVTALAAFRRHDSGTAATGAA